MNAALRLVTVPNLALLVALSTAGCGAPVEETSEATELHSEALGLSLGDILNKLFKKKHQPGEPPEEVAEPESFTPASAAARSGRLAGAAVAYGPLMNDENYRNTLAAEFNYITPENETKWGVLQPTDDPRVWDYSQADAIYAFAQEHDMKVKGHTLIWHSQAPSFIHDGLSKAQLSVLMTAHILRTGLHYRQQTYAWDVVNEAVADDGSGLRESVFSDKLGENFIKQSFILARAATHRDTKLHYNDYNILSLNDKSDAVYELMQRMRQRNIPVHGVGFQGHVDARFAPGFDEMVENFNRFGQLGLSVNISELDVRVAGIAGDRARKLAVQKQVYQRIAAACMAADNCEAITTWGFTDAHSWVDQQFGSDDPLLFDENYQRKPAYYGLVHGFLGVMMDEPGLEPNLIGNSSFEAGLNDWSSMGDAVLSVEMDTAHSGVRSARSSARTGSWQGPRYDLMVLAKPGRQYDISVFAKLAGVQSDNLNLTAQVTCGGEGTFVRVADAVGGDSDWVELSGTLQVPDCDLQGLAIYVEGPAAGVDILVDDLAVREQPRASLLPNGDFEQGINGWFRWGTGTASVDITNDAHSGVNAGVGMLRQDTWHGIATNILPFVEADSTYHISGYAKVAGASSDNVSMTAKLRCAGGSDQYIWIAGATANDSGWVELSGSLQVPECSLEEVTLYAEGPQAGVDILLDDVMMWKQEDGLGANVVGNGGFESGTSGWYGFGDVNIEASAARARSGAYSGFVSARTADWMGLATNLVGSVNPGSSYRVRGYAQVGTGSSTVRLSLKTSCEGQSDAFSTIASATATDSDWVVLEGTMTVSDCELNDVSLYIEGAPAGTDIYLDDVSVREQL